MSLMRVKYIKSIPSAPRGGLWPFVILPLAKCKALCASLLRATFNAISFGQSEHYPRPAKYLIHVASCGYVWQPCASCNPKLSPRYKHVKPIYIGDTLINSFIKH